MIKVNYFIRYLVSYRSRCNLTQFLINENDFFFDYAKASHRSNLSI